jgi:hypothetical protein
MVLTPDGPPLRGVHWSPPVNEVYRKIREAILNKQQIVCMYDGYHREMCPHAIGTKNGELKAFCYQFAGESSSGIGPPGAFKNWRCVFIDKVTKLEVRDGPWHTATNHSQTQTCIDEVDAEVDWA